MVISTNPRPPKKDFEKLLDNTIQNLSRQAKQQKKEYLVLLRNKLEYKVEELMNENASGTPFEGTIELVSGQKFPDIVAKRYFGVEVKSTKQNHWTTTGNSVLESTRVEDVENIYLLFGKMYEPIEFKYRPYEECLSEVVVTHSPRYLIDMNLEEGKTIFDKIEISYNSLRKHKNPIKPIIDYYKKQLKEGEEVWWIDQEGEQSKSLIVKFWNSLPIDLRQMYIAKGMVYFPEVFNGDYNKFTLWLYESESIICPNVRDLFSAGGQAEIKWKNITYTKIPKVFLKLNQLLNYIRQALDESDKSELMYYWDVNKIEDVNSSWIELVYKNFSHHSQFNNHPFKRKIKEFLKENL